MRRLALIALLAAQPANAETPYVMPANAEAAEFVTSNLLATFYHELGHALIDVLQLPVLGREEDAADTLSSLLINDIWDEDSATAMIYATSLSFALYDAEAAEEGQELPFHDVHSLDLQRYYNAVCLFYGANPDLRDDVAKELELPPERAEGCADEYELAQASWGGLLEGLEPSGKTKGLRLDSPADEAIAALIQEEITDLNKTYGLPEEIAVRVEDCGEANAFYDSADRSITICREYAADLQRLWETQNP